MRLKISNAALWAVLVAAWIAFMPLGLLVERQDLFEVINAMIMAVASGVVVGFWPRAWAALRMPVHILDAADLLIIGIVVCSVSVTVIFGGQWLWRALDKPEWIIDSFFLAFTRWAFLTGAIMVLTSSATRVNGIVTPGMFRRSCVVVMAALIVALSLSVFFGLP
jgi:hypothetical protein